jgi:hypothetical protein
VTDAELSRTALAYRRFAEAEAAAAAPLYAEQAADVADSGEILRFLAELPPGGGSRTCCF